MYAELITALEDARALVPPADLGTLSMLDIMINHYQWLHDGGSGPAPMTPGP